MKIVFTISLDEHGHVCESTSANVFIIKSGTLITPNSSTDILEGITRDTVQKLAVHLGINHVERAVDRSELYIADEAFLCGSSAKITPIITVDKRKIGTGKIGNITKKLIKEYENAQNGKIEVFKYWLTTTNSV